MSLAKRRWQRDQRVYIGLEGCVGGVERSPAWLERRSGAGVEEVGEAGRPLG